MGRFLYFCIPSTARYIPVAARRREQPPGAALAAFKKKTAYGPMFACCVCSTAHFLDEVVEVGRVAALDTEEGRGRYLDPPSSAPTLTCSPSWTRPGCA